MGHYGHAGVRVDGDFNGDGVVNFIDYQMLEQNFGRKPPAVGAAPVEGASVPEPTGTVGLTLALGWGFVRRRKGRVRDGCGGQSPPCGSDF
jgi:hypothetical protein